MGEMTSPWYVADEVGRVRVELAERLLPSFEQVDVADVGPWGTRSDVDFSSELCPHQSLR